jgi:hypothetical protein
MEKVKRIAALVAAILLAILVLGGAIYSEVIICKAGYWLVAVVFLALFCFAAGPAWRSFLWLFNYGISSK